MADGATETSVGHPPLEHPPFRILPALNDRNTPYWTAGRDGVLRFQRCQDCGYYLHPAGVVCPKCWTKNLAYEDVSGRATVLTFTINHQPWMPVPELPFVLAIVGIEEQDDVRVTTNIVHCPVDAVYVGMPVTVLFEAHADDGVWLPMFEPALPPAGDKVESADVAVDPNEVLERRAVISGAGQSDIGRRLFRDPLELTVDACLAAIADAGLTPADIDGISTYPGVGGGPKGFTGAGVTDIHDALRLNLNWYSGGLERPGQLGAVIDACLAVACGLATHVLCFRSVWEGSAQGAGGRAAVMPGGESRGAGGAAAARPGKAPRADGIMEWTLPYGAPSAAPWIAMFAQRHFHEYGTTREQLAQIALNARKNAALNPKGIYTDPMSMDDYLAARMISSPFCLFDCDVPCDGGTAVIVSRADTAPDLRKPPIQVEAVGTALHGRPSWDQFDDLATMACRDAGAQLWTRTDLTPADVQLAEMYDGFSFITMAWLEAMKFCGVGESGPFVEGGQRIALDGELPLNTNGGQLSSGRLHGFGFMHEACVQLWGEAGARQVPGDPEVGVACAGGGPLAGALLLTHCR